MKPLRGFAQGRGPIVFPNATKEQLAKHKNKAANNGIGADELTEKQREQIRRDIANR